MPAKLLLKLGVLLLVAAGASAAGPPGTLLLSNGDFLAGEWRDSESAEWIKWQPSFVARPYEFEWSAIGSIAFPPPAEPTPIAGAFRFDLFNGDALIGDLVAVSDERFTIATRLEGQGEPQQLSAPRSLVRSIRRVGSDAGKLRFSGPGDLADWNTIKNVGWVYSRGGIATNIKGASASRDVPLPHLALIEVALSWDKKADFSLELGVTKRRLKAITDGFEIWIQDVNGQPVRVREARNQRQIERERQRDNQVTDAFRLEVVGDNLIAVRETQESADLQPLQQIEPGAGRLQLRLYLDQNNNRLIVTTASGVTLADLHVETPYSPFDSGVQLNNRDGDIRLDRLSITEWNGEPPVSGAVDQSAFQLANGETLRGDLVGFRAADGELLIAAEADASNQPASGDDRDAGQPEPGSDSSDSAEPAVAEPDAEESDSEEPDAKESDAEEPSTQEPRTEDPDAEDMPAQQSPHVVRLDQLVSVVFPTPAGADAYRRAGDATLLTATLQGGVQVTGSPQGLVDRRLRLFCQDFDATIAVPLAMLQSVRVASAGLPATASAAAGAKPSKFPRLETDDVRSVGELAGAPDTDGASCLLWRPFGSRNAEPLLDGVSGRVLFREPPPPKSAEPDKVAAPQPARQRGVLGAIASVFSYTPPKTTKQASAPQPATMYLRAGDKLPCAIERIDDEGVYFSSPFSAAGFAPHKHVKAIELVTRGVDGRLTPDRRDQLLTLPRGQTNNPPTHLLVSTKGDYLRCRLLRVSEETVAVEVRLEELEIDRSRVARIIWFDPPPKDSEEAAAGTGRDEPGDHPRVQAVRRDGVRLTFDLRRLTSPQGEDAPAARLEGVSEVLDECSVSLDDIDLLLMGHRVEQAAAELSYQRWKMKNAILPREPEEGDAGDASASFPLVGEVAPELPLPFFDGGAEPPAKELDLASFQGKVVVLDFWASWCGPCMQVMPVLHKLGEEYADRDVLVVAVNLQDPPEAIAAALDRLGFKPVVALDRDGVAAQRYQVTGIPQTVVINREGVIANVFVGGGAKFEQRLRAAIEAAVQQAKVEE
ncbi:Thiol:disulfide interchange protein CycY precursor [Posidoniimonas polymericola]|uniref:Thiol:disulfide interchange protein CycY n=1 Tax=Posidoniimonas polymericola TaxID=2528002 RepID=A0A5C5YQY6_9BACT|nr:TlpA disulfide reductase family protein [Posidoniimonas polymericola]TWT77269.1 Thiol:disulfide interchange protein CycY precursor [Posidoniimonas polymericola]